MSLPLAFIEEMRSLWNEYRIEGDLESFLEALEGPSRRGLRANGLKLEPSQLALLLDLNFAKQRIPWSDDGFYYEDELTPGRHPAYYAGLFYIQETSAMLPAMVMAACPGDKVLDLCAAPGGKTARLAADLQGDGLLWSNEISQDRAKALLRNVELTGCSNCIISNEDPQNLAEKLPDYFDKILVDAPCSGSGMFRRDKSAIASWTRYGTESCALLQTEILDSADKMLKPGGLMLYSTCSFSLAEDEAMIARFLEKHPDYSIINALSTDYLPEAALGQISPGLPFQNRVELTGTIRIWPHLAEGDGHFCALLRKLKDSRARTLNNSDYMETLSDQTAKADWLLWAQTILSRQGFAKIEAKLSDWSFRQFKGQLHLLPPGAVMPGHTRLIKTGTYLGSFKDLNKGTNKKGTNKKHSSPGSNQIFEPAHSWFLTLEAADFRFRIRFSRQDLLLQKYLRGETLVIDPDLIESETYDKPAQGQLILICLDDYPVGAAKFWQGTLKNQLPPAWRKRN